MKAQGRVIKIEGEFAVVGVKRHSACDTCRAQCGGHCDKAATVETKVKNTLDAKIGDEVELFSKTSAVLGASLLVFILPLIMALLGYIIPFSLGLKNAFSIIICLLSFFFSFFVIYKIWGKKDKFTDIKMIRITGK